MSAFFRKRVRGLLKTTFSAPSSVIDSAIGEETERFCNDENEIPPPTTVNGGLLLNGYEVPTSSSIIYEQILNGKQSARRVAANAPEVYSGKTGLDLPVIHVDTFLPAVKACYTGPDGGLTKVQQMRQLQMARMANLDDELSLSEEEDFDEDGEEDGNRKKKLKVPKNTTPRANSMEALGFTSADLVMPGTSTANYDWTNGDEARAYGLSMSLYEKHPITGVNAGTPIADVFGIIARENNAILALADGVNWGEGARLAARCAIRGAIDHLNAAIERSAFETTKDVFHCLLGAFHASHALILQEGGALTTLCVAVVAPVRNSESYVLCVCNVGDSLCFVYNIDHGVIEVTQASHDIGQMRDMRDAGGALGPVDGRNPQLHNLTCSMTFLEEGDLVFITSDGVSDNFDPVVGKFCSIKKTEVERDLGHADMDPFTGANTFSSASSNPHNNRPSSTKPSQSSVHKTKSAPSTNGITALPDNFFATSVPSTLNHQNQQPRGTLPCVDSFERHELMLLRMADVITNGLNGGGTASRLAKKSSFERQHNFPYGTASSNSSSQNSSAMEKNRRRFTRASEVCKNLIQFSYRLSSAKRSTLEDPELYRTRTHSKTEERLRRKMIRNMIMGMPGKLDHASAVAYCVGKWPGTQAPAPKIPQDCVEKIENNRNTAQNNKEETTSSSSPATEILLQSEEDIKSSPKKNDDDDFEGIDSSGSGHSETADEPMASAVAAAPPPIPLHLPQHQTEEKEEEEPNNEAKTIVGIKSNMNLDLKNQLASNGSPSEDQSPTEAEGLRSPYEDVPILGFNSNESPRRVLLETEAIGSANRVRPSSSKKRHSRGSQARHTLGVDVTWLKRLVTNKQQMNGEKSAGGQPQQSSIHQNRPQQISGSSQGPNSQNNEYDEVPLGYGSPMNMNTYSPTHGFESGTGTNFSLRKQLRTFIKQTREAVNGSSPYGGGGSSRSCHQAPLPILGISALKTPPASGRRPKTTRV